MKRILIADASKASLVMTSEVFKDHFPGVQVVVARTSADALALAKTAGELDAFIIDYDLPDRDGAYTAACLKKMFTQPILITAFDRPDVQERIDSELSAFDDCLSWLKKPVKPEIVVSLARRFIEGQHRCQRRLNCALPAFIEVEFAPPPHMSAATHQTVGGVRAMQVARVKVVAKGPSKGKAKAAPSSNASASVKKAGGTPIKKAVATRAKKVAGTTTKKAVATTAKKSPGSATKKSVSITVKRTLTTNTNKRLEKIKSTPVTGKIDAKTTKAKKSLAAVKNSKAKGLFQKTPTKTAKKTLPEVPLKPIRKFIPVLIDDVSLGGAKIRVSNQEMVFPWVGKGKPSQMLCDFREGQILNLVVPPSQVIQAGGEALEKWQKTQAKILAGMARQDSQGAAHTSQEKSIKLSTLSATERRVRQSELKETAQTSAQTLPPALRGEVRWVVSNETFTFCGLRSETINISKRLFECMIEIESKAYIHMSPIVSPNVSRAPKLNA